MICFSTFFFSKRTIEKYIIAVRLLVLQASIFIPSSRPASLSQFITFALLYIKKTYARYSYCQHLRWINAMWFQLPLLFICIILFIIFPLEYSGILDEHCPLKMTIWQKHSCYTAITNPVPTCKDPFCKLNSLKMFAFGPLLKQNIFGTKNVLQKRLKLLSVVEDSGKWTKNCGLTALSLVDAIQVVYRVINSLEPATYFLHLDGESLMKRQ